MVCSATGCCPYGGRRLTSAQRKDALLATRSLRRPVCRASSVTMSHLNSQIGWSHEGGLPVVEGIAIGLALIWASDPVPRRVAGTVQQERARLARAIARATRGVKELARLSPPAEAELFAPA